MPMRAQFSQILLISILLLITALPVIAQELDVRRPGQREFVTDEAGMLAPDSIAQIRPLCDRLLTDKATPIIVVTMESKALHGGANMSIEAYQRKTVLPGFNLERAGGCRQPQISADYEQARGAAVQTGTVRAGHCRRSDCP